ncbi:MAG: GNAT family N-acetyltransferase [Lachnospiraceae bacterium]|nr:GNAT family N-acetyltransferase [Lachnospiraceae bacterium]
MNIKTPDSADIPALRSLWRESFDDSKEFLDCFFSTAFSTNRCRCILSNDALVAALHWFDCMYMDKPVAYLYAIATAKAYQGQGLCHALMQDTHLHLSKLGYKGAILVPENAKLFELYQGIGYQTCCQHSEFACSASGEKIVLRHIDIDEYACLRRKLLPANSVIQEHENLYFLANQASLYAGETFLLAANIENQQLFGIELLGDSTAAPHILHTLNCSYGTFRTPGGGIPFAMYHDLSEGSLPLPSYFGLGFD